MKQAHPLLLLLLIPWLPAMAMAGPQHDEPNVNSRYAVENVSFTGVSESRLSATLRAAIQDMVGQKYDPSTADDLASRIRSELRGYLVTYKIKRGEKPEHVRVIYDARRRGNPPFDVHLPPLVYHSYDGFSGALAAGVESHGSYFSVGVVSNADELLERFEGVRFRYEHRRVGTDRVQIGIGYDLYHPSFQPEIADALVAAPQVPGTYRTRRVFAPSVSVFPVAQVKLTFGGSFQNLRSPELTTELQRAYAWTFDAQLRDVVRSGDRFRHRFSVDYGLRAATTSLDSDFVYTRHEVVAEYSLSSGRHGLGAAVQVGRLGGTAPLFERFSLGNSSTLRGWDRFDIAPLGGDRLAYGSLEYRYRPFRVFYDFGTVWDEGQPAVVRHAVGLGVSWRSGFFLSVGFPVRLNRVRPAVMFGFKG